MRWPVRTLRVRAAPAAWVRWPLPAALRACEPAASCLSRVGHRLSCSLARSSVGSVGSGPNSRTEQNGRV